MITEKIKMLLFIDHYSIASQAISLVTVIIIHYFLFNISIIVYYFYYYFLTKFSLHRIFAPLFVTLAMSWPLQASRQTVSMSRTPKLVSTATLPSLRPVGSCLSLQRLLIPMQQAKENARTKSNTVTIETKTTNTF